MASGRVAGCNAGVKMVQAFIAYQAPEKRNEDELSAWLCEQRDAAEAIGGRLEWVSPAAPGRPRRRLLRLMHPATVGSTYDTVDLLVRDMGRFGLRPRIIARRASDLIRPELRRAA